MENLKDKGDYYVAKFSNNCDCYALAYKFDGDIEKLNRFIQFLNGSYTTFSDNSFDYISVEHNVDIEIVKTTSGLLSGEDRVILLPEYWLVYNPHDMVMDTLSPKELEDKGYISFNANLYTEDDFCDEEDYDYDDIDE